MSTVQEELRLANAHCGYQQYDETDLLTHEDLMKSKLVCQPHAILVINGRPVIINEIIYMADEIRITTANAEEYHGD